MAVATHYMPPRMFTHRVNVQTPSNSVTAGGSPGRTWSTAFSCRAAVHPLRGRERTEAKKVTAELSHKVTTWHRRDYGFTPDMRLLVNHQSHTLGAAISSTTATSITLAASPLLPGAGQYWLLVGTEIMRVTGGQGTTTLTVARGQKETTAATHLNGATVTVVQLLNITDVVNPDSENRQVELYCTEVV